MKLMKTLFASCLLGSSMLAGYALAEEAKGAPAMAEQQMQSAPAQAVVVGDKLNINTASAAEIQKALVGIGAKKAEAIVQYREKHGPFTAVEQLLEVQGIGKVTLEKNQDRISL